MRIVTHHPPVHSAPSRQDTANRAPVPLNGTRAVAAASLPARAGEAWQALNRTMGAGDGRYLDNPHGDPAAAWSFGQTAEAALHLASINGNYHRVDQIFSALRSYRLGGGYA